jgi:hypothetical protein
MSIYRAVKRAPRSDVYQTTEHVLGPERGEQRAREASPSYDWSGHRKANPVEILLPTTVGWMTGLPPPLRPAVLVERFSRIANQLAALWNRPDELAPYLRDLRVDNRGGRKGFPIAVLRELEGLNGYCATLYPHCFMTEPAKKDPA